MSKFATKLTLSHPDWGAFPAPLEQAWSWMEGQGFGPETPAGDLLSPYPPSRLAHPVFRANLSLDGWFKKDDPGSRRLLPLLEAGGDGSQIALWRDDEGTERIVLLSSEGTGCIVGQDSRELLSLLAVGYDEILEFNLGDQPEFPLTDEMLAPLRAWVETELDEEVPDEWPVVGDDEFSVWLDAALGRTAGRSVVPPAVSTSHLRGEVLKLIELLGEPDGPAVGTAIASLTGAKLKNRLRSSAAALRKVGLEVESDRSGLRTMWIRMTEREFGSIIRKEAPAYPRAAALIDGLDASSTMSESLDLLGEPERQGTAFLRYVVNQRYVHLAFDDGRLAQITLMCVAY